MFRTWASSIAIVCSAAAMMFDPGALAAMMPRFVARTEADLCADLVKRHLERGDRADDVERAVVAAVRDPDDLPLDVALTARDRHPVGVAHRLRDLRAVDALRHAHGGDDVRDLVVRAEDLQPEALDGLARGAGEDRVALEDMLKPLLLDQFERDVE